MEARFGDLIAPDVFAEIRREMELVHCKWDAQVGDVSTLTPFPLLVSTATWNSLSAQAEALAAETVALEEALLERPDLHRAIALPRPLRALFGSGAKPTPAAARVMRFDFHWTTGGWRISEVNSDVPGGFTEATSFTRLVASSDARPAGDPVAAIVASLVRHAGVVAFINAAGHMEDHQVVAYLAKELPRSEVIAPSHLRFSDGRAYIENEWCKSPVAAIYRFFQAEWLPRLPKSIEWQPLFVNGRTPVVNPGWAVLTESKRLPLVWDRLNVSIPNWRRLLPETRALSDAPWSNDDDWLIKTAYSNTGDTVSVRAAMSAADWRLRVWEARLRPGKWLAQRRFELVPLRAPDPFGDLYPCIGVYTVDGRAAGAYARVSSNLVIDAFARDIALLISE
jgi:glutathionylspermidine synthase